MKHAVPLLLLALFGLSSCNTLVTRRDLYSPTKGKGYWTTREHHGKDAADAEQKKTPPPPIKPAPDVAR